MSPVLRALCWHRVGDKGIRVHVSVDVLSLQGPFSSIFSWGFHNNAVREVVGIPTIRTRKLKLREDRCLTLSRKPRLNMSAWVPCGFCPLPLFKDEMGTAPFRRPTV